MKCINFDSHFNQYVQRWMAENRSHYKNVDEMEAQMPDVYLKWINIPMDWLDGQTPALYFEQYDDPQMLCKWMLKYIRSSIPLPDQLLERIAALGEEAVEPLMEIAFDREQSDEARMSALGTLEQIQSERPMNNLISLIAHAREDENELSNLAGEMLVGIGDKVMPGVIDAMVKAYVVDAAGNKTEKPAEEVFDMMKTNKDLRADYERKTLILFEATDGRVIIPLIGKGLWDDIWGYIALEKDMNTVSGIVMAHKSETPGLGAEIATPAHQALYRGKTLFEKGDFVSITLRKGGAKDPAHEVDAVTGGTKTSDGVTAMLRDNLSEYLPFFEKARTAASAAGAEESNDQKVESNE